MAAEPITTYSIDTDAFMRGVEELVEIRRDYTRWTHQFRYMPGNREAVGAFEHNMRRTIKNVSETLERALGLFLPQNLGTPACTVGFTAASGVAAITAQLDPRLNKVVRVRMLVETPYECTEYDESDLRSLKRYAEDAIGLFAGAGYSARIVEAHMEEDNCNYPRVRIMYAMAPDVG